MLKPVLLWALLPMLVFSSCDDGEAAAPAVEDAQVADASPVDRDAPLNATPPELDAEPLELDAELDAEPLEPDAEPDAAPLEPDAAPLDLPWSCEDGATFLYDPFGRTPSVFPDDIYTRPDPSSVTGLVVDMSEAPWVDDLPGGFAQVFEDMSTLDGFGTSGGIHLRFSVGLTPFSEAHDAVRLVEILAGGGLKDLEYEPVFFDEGRALALWPIRPLEPSTPHGVIIRSDVALLSGGCLQPGQRMGGILTGQAADPQMAAMTPRYEALIAAAELEIEEVGAALVFTTQSVYETSVAIAEDIASRSYEWAEQPTCEPDGRYLHCEGRFEAADYRDADGIVRGATPVRIYMLPVSVWFTHNPADPPPAIILGHGITQDRSLCGYVASTTDAENISFLGIDAVLHGEHPAGAPEGAAALLMEFFAVDIASRYVDGQLLRDNFRQSTFDRLQLLRMIMENPDLTGDGVPDLDVSHIGYFGVSFGGIMGSEYLALSDATSMAYLGMAGGRLSEFVRSVPSGFEALSDLIFGASTPPVTRDFILAGLQTVVERGDPINFAPRVMARRLSVAPGEPPHILAIMAMDDGTVPNAATLALMKAYRMPHARPSVEPVPYLEPQQTPLQGNVVDGKLTGGFFQYDHIQRNGRTEDAGHINVLKGDETRHQFLHYYLTWLESGLPEIIDPYEAMGLEGP